MKFYNETQLLYLETDMSGVWPGAALLQTRSVTSCPRDKGPKQQHTQTHHICQQKPVKCGKKIQQH